MTIAQCEHSATNRQCLLAALEADPTALPNNLSERLEKLTNYYRDVPKETARFTRDAEMLRRVTEVCRQRLAVIQQLREVLKV